MTNIPDWFTGTIYNKGEEVTNSFTGKKMELNAIELSIYDFIMGYQMLTETIEPSIMGNRTKTFHKALMWFRENNPEAYHILLD
jgi:hypothetical protein